MIPVDKYHNNMILKIFFYVIRLLVKSLNSIDKHWIILVTVSNHQFIINLYITNNNIYQQLLL